MPGAREAPPRVQRTHRLKTPKGLYTKARGKRGRPGKGCLECPALKVGGIEDHVHVACRLSRKIAAAELVKRLKKESSKWVKAQDPSLGGFKEERRRLLQKYGVDYDERYVWD